MSTSSRHQPATDRRRARARLRLAACAIALAAGLSAPAAHAAIPADSVGVYSEEL
jgi:hypothetical protein